MVKVLIAVGSKSYSDILIETFSKHSDYFTLSSQEVLHRRFLEEIVEMEHPDLLVIHDTYLESDFTRNEMKEQELTTYFRKLRRQFDDSIRIVFLCERLKGDSFLSSLVSMGVHDIFNSNSFDLDAFIEQLKDKPRFHRVEKFLITPVSNPSLMVLDEEEQGEEKDSASTENEAAPAKETVKAKEEKPIVQKVINKNVIKRDYIFNVHNFTEKVVGVPIKRKIVMVGSASSRTGSTFISHVLAKALIDWGVSTTYVESPFAPPYSYDRFFGKEHAYDYRSKFYQFSPMYHPEFQYHYEWKVNDVDVICKNSTDEPLYKEEEVTFETFIKVLFSNSATVTILDVGTDWEYELFQDVFDIADHAYFVFEPDIPFIQNFEQSKDKRTLFLRERINNEKCSIIGNRFDKPTHDSTIIQEIYGEHLKTYFPVFPTQDVFSAHIEGKFLNEYRSCQKVIELAVEPILKDILPMEIFQKKKRGKGLIKGLISKRISVEKKETKQ